jgi:hypothetical protein
MTTKSKDLVHAGSFEGLNGSSLELIEGIVSISLQVFVCAVGRGVLRLRLIFALKREDQSSLRMTMRLAYSIA